MLSKKREYREERGVAFAISLGWRWLAPQSQSNIAINNTRHPIAVTLRVQGPDLPVLARAPPRGRWAVILTREDRRMAVSSTRSSH